MRRVPMLLITQLFETECTLNAEDVPHGNRTVHTAYSKRRGHGPAWGNSCSRITLSSDLHAIVVEARREEGTQLRDWDKVASAKAGRCI